MVWKLKHIFTQEALTSINVNKVEEVIDALKIIRAARYDQMKTSN